MDVRRGSRIAYAVPFEIRRELASSQYVLANVGQEAITGVSFTLHGAGVMATSAPTLLNPGDSVVVTIVAEDLARNTILVVRWFRPNGVEYLWRVSF
jgi:hypothetical protein